jgi:hypothetical protein
MPSSIRIKTTIRIVPSMSFSPPQPRTEKADVAEHPQAFDHVGLLGNEPPGTAGLLFI